MIVESIWEADGFVTIAATDGFQAANLAAGDRLVWEYTTSPGSNAAPRVDGGGGSIRQIKASELLDEVYRLERHVDALLAPKPGWVDRLLNWAVRRRNTARPVNTSSR